MPCASRISASIAVYISLGTAPLHCLCLPMDVVKAALTCTQNWCLFQAAANMERAWHGGACLSLWRVYLARTILRGYMPFSLHFLVCPCPAGQGETQLVCCEAQKQVLRCSAQESLSIVEWVLFIRTSGIFGTARPLPVHPCYMFQVTTRSMSAVMFVQVIIIRFNDVGAFLSPWLRG